MDFGLLILRLFAGVTMLLAHGLPKLSRYSSLTETFPDPLGVGSHLSLILALSSEVVFAALLAAGLFTRISSLSLIVTMAVAFFLHHGADPFKDKELSFMYMGMYLALFLTGPGRYSVQNFFQVSTGRFQWWLK